MTAPTTPALSAAPLPQPAVEAVANAAAVASAITAHPVRLASPARPAKMARPAHLAPTERRRNTRLYLQRLAIQNVQKDRPDLPVLLAMQARLASLAATARLLSLVNRVMRAHRGLLDHLASQDRMESRARLAHLEKCTNVAVVGPALQWPEVELRRITQALQRPLKPA